MSDKLRPQGILKVCPAGDKIEKLIIEKIVIEADGKLFGCFHRGDTYMRHCDNCKYNTKKRRT